MAHSRNTNLGAATLVLSEDYRSTIFFMPLRLGAVSGSMIVGRIDRKLKSPVNSDCSEQILSCGD